MRSSKFIKIDILENRKIGTSFDNKGEVENLFARVTHMSGKCQRMVAQEKCKRYKSAHNDVLILPV